MATLEPKPVKQLRDFLQDEQEPSNLEFHLEERGHLNTSLNLRSSPICCNENSTEVLGRTSTDGRNKSKKGISQRRKVIRVVYNHFISMKAWVRSNSSNHREGQLDVTEKGSNNRQVAGYDGFSSAGSTAVFNSCSKSDLEKTSSTSLQKESLSFIATTFQPFQLINSIDRDRKHQLLRIEECKQLSPVSVLENVPSEAGSPDPNNKKEFKTPKEENPSKTEIIFPRKVTDDSILAASLWRIQFDSTTDKQAHPEVAGTKEILQSNQSSQYLKSKMILQQTKQLLFDCVREAIDNQAIKERQQQQQHTDYLRSPELGMLIVEKMKSWGKQSGDEWNIAKLLHLELLNSTQEWTDYDAQRIELGLEIGDDILEGIVNESVIQMMDLVTNYQILR